MNAMKKLFIVCFLAVTALSAYGQSKERSDDTILLGGEIMPKDTTKKRIFKNRLIAPKGEWQCGLSVMYANFSSSDSEYMMLLQGMNANASLLRLSPEAAYTFADNHAVGARFQYTNVNGLLDSATADILGNLSLSLADVHALSASIGGSVFQRTYIGLDRYGRVGIFWDYILGFKRSKTQFYTGEAASSYSISKKVHLGFAPGIVYFPMNNVSIQASICLADASYNNVTAYSDGKVAGSNQSWKVQARLNVLDINFGLTIHL